MPRATGKRPQKKRAGQYHHGDLRRALIDEALRMIDTQGVEGITLRAVGDALGVSRTALYRHFADKQALIAAVSREGFHMLRQATVSAWDAAGRGTPGFDAMGAAYVQFAAAHPSHYRVMFSRFRESGACEPEFLEEANSSFQALVDALAEQQRDGLVRADDTRLMALFVWSVVHGVAMLTIDGQLAAHPGAADLLQQYARQQIRRAVTNEILIPDASG